MGWFRLKTPSVIHVKVIAIVATLSVINVKVIAIVAMTTEGVLPVPQLLKLKEAIFKSAISCWATIF